MDKVEFVELHSVPDWSSDIDTLEEVDEYSPLSAVSKLNVLAISNYSLCICYIQIIE